MPAAEVRKRGGGRKREVGPRGPDDQIDRSFIILSKERPAFHPPTWLGDKLRQVAPAPRRQDAGRGGSNGG